MQKRIYVTHCSAKKDDSLRGTGKNVTPDRLYTAKPLQRFVRTCKDKGVAWAIFSDKYGVVLPAEPVEWYDKHPGTVTDEEFRSLVASFTQRLAEYDEVWFYHNPGRFHPLYRRLVEQAGHRGLEVVLFSHLSQIR